MLLPKVVFGPTFHDSNKLTYDSKGHKEAFHSSSYLFPQYSVLDTLSQSLYMYSASTGQQSFHTTEKSYWCKEYDLYVSLI